MNSKAQGSMKTHESRSPSLLFDQWALQWYCTKTHPDLICSLTFTCWIYGAAEDLDMQIFYRNSSFLGVCLNMPEALIMHLYQSICTKFREIMESYRDSLPKNENWLTFKLFQTCVNLFVLLNPIYLKDLQFFCCISANHHIILISEGSCDTEDWSNDAENSVLITGINDI